MDQLHPSRNQDTERQQTQTLGIKILKKASALTEQIKSIWGGPKYQGRDIQRLCVLLNTFIPTHLYCNAEKIFKQISWKSLISPILWPELTFDETDSHNVTLLWISIFIVLKSSICVTKWFSRSPVCFTMEASGERSPEGLWWWLVLPLYIL